MKRPIRRVALLTLNPWEGGGEPQPYSYAAWRLLASLRADPRNAEVEVEVMEGKGWTLDQWEAALARFQPDLVAACTYVWSLPVFHPLLHRWRALDPGCTIVLGGPSARPAMLGFAPFSALADVVDAITTGDGELPLRGAVHAPLAEVPGWLLAPEWRSTGPLPRGLDGVASPLQLGLAPPGVSAHLQTYLGCPMSCSFCAWGEERASPIFSVDALVAELEAVRRHDVASVISVDAGLNLNRAALRNLLEAEAKVGALAGRRFYSQVYPSWFGGELETLLRSTQAHVSIGLQSADPALLKQVGRHAARASFEAVLGKVSDFAEVTVELILGLPGDSPQGFVETLRYAIGLGAWLRVYSCLVLPDALMTRGGGGLRWDPISLELIEAPGWPAEALAEVRTAMDGLAAERGGFGTRQWPRPSASAEAQLGEMPPAPMWAIPPRRERPQVDVRGIAERIAGDLLRTTNGAWRLVGVHPEGAELRVELAAGDTTTTARWRDGTFVSDTLPEPLRGTLP